MKTDASPAAIDSLRRLGFNEMEALVYCELLRVPGSTGYGIAKGINRPHANVYQGLTALEAKGAVLLEQGTKKSYSAVPVEELLSHLKTRFDEYCSDAVTALRDVEAGKATEDAFYKLTTRDQMFARARGIFAEAHETIIFYGHPAIVPILRSEIEAANARGVKVAGLVFREEDLVEGTAIRVSEVADRVLQTWSANLLIVVVDGRQFLIGLLAQDTGEVIQSLWVTSQFATALFHNALVSDIILHEQQVLKRIGSPHRHVFGDFSPALRELLGLSAIGGRTP